MEKFIQFVVNHWPLWLALVLVLALIIYEEFKGKLAGVARISPQELIHQLNREAAVVVDIRDRKAYDAGHIIHAVAVPAAELETQTTVLEKHKNKTLVVVDQTGQALGIAAKLRAKGFKVQLLSGGLTAWQNAGLPLTKK